MRCKIVVRWHQTHNAHIKSQRTLLTHEPPSDSPRFADEMVSADSPWMRVSRDPIVLSSEASCHNSSIAGLIHHHNGYKYISRSTYCPLFSFIPNATLQQAQPDQSEECIQTRTHQHSRSLLLVKSEEIGLYVQKSKFIETRKMDAGSLLWHKHHQSASNSCANLSYSGK